MWHEARRQERKIRGMLVDYRRRAERRKDYYEKIKTEPTQFLQLHGRQCKIHLDQNVSATAENVVMMMWKGQIDNLIDRFDVRAHLDSISSEEEQKEDEENLTQEERQLNYERYRIIAQNSFLRIPEEKFLKQLHLEEQFGYAEVKPKKDSKSGVSIGFNYEENAGFSQDTCEDSEEDFSDSDLDVDLIINVTKLDTTQANEMNKHGCIYGMSSNDFYSFLINDLEEAEAAKLAREEEQEKALFSGRKSRRERRYHREKRLANRIVSPPSYAAKNSPIAKLRNSKSKSRSRSTSPVSSGKITYITSFGDDEEPSTSKFNLRSKQNRSRSKSSERFYNRPSTSKDIFTRRSRSRCRRCIRSRYRRSKSTSSSRSSSRSKNGHRRYSKTRTSSSSSSASSTSYSGSLINNSGKRSAESSKTCAEPAVKVLPRYYGRKKSNTSSDSDLETACRKEIANKPNKSSKKSTNIIIERLRRKRQVLINKQFKADKIAAQLKTERERLEQQAREDELREMSIKLRKRQREKRHANDSFSSSDSDFSSKTDGSERSRGRDKDRKRYFYRKRTEIRRNGDERSNSRSRRRDGRQDKELRRDVSISRSDSKDELDNVDIVAKLVNY